MPTNREQASRLGRLELAAVGARRPADAGRPRLSDRGIESPRRTGEYYALSLLPGRPTAGPIRARSTAAARSLVDANAQRLDTDGCSGRMEMADAGAAPIVS
jgi:hypothetical protein